MKKEKRRIIFGSDYKSLQRQDTLVTIVGVIFFIVLLALVLGVFSLLIWVLFFYIPIDVTKEAQQTSLLDEIIGILGLILWWILILSEGYAAAAAFYGFKRKYLIFKTITREEGSKVGAIILFLLSYAFAIYMFAVVFLHLSYRDPSAFNCGELTILSALYFSLVTMTTIGYGDIIALSNIARFFVMTEVIVNLIYTLFFFSIISWIVIDSFREMGAK